MTVWQRGAAMAAVVVVAGCSSGIQGMRPAEPPPPGWARATGPRAELRRAIDSMVADPQFRNAHWGIVILDPATRDTLYSRNAGKLFMPASNQKLLTGAVALAQLGPDYRFRTAFVARGGPDTVGGTGIVVGGVVGAGAPPDGVRRDGLLRDGVLHGDLVVVGRGDPTVSDHMFVDAMAPLRAAADSLAARGVRHVAGALLKGGDAFPDANHGFGWAWDDFDYAYSAGVDELLFNEGFVRVTVHGGVRADDAPRVTTAPGDVPTALRVTAVTIEPLVTLGAGDLVVDSSTTGRPASDVQVTTDPVTGALVVGGVVLAGDSVSVSVAHRDPAAAYLAAFARALTERGITIERGIGTPTTDTLVAGDTLFTMQSPTLREILPALEKPSQNQIAEMLFKTLGLEKTGVGSADSGRRVVETQLLAWGAAPDGFAVRDGSGLSRHDYVSPETIVRVLDAVRHDSAFAVFYNALPVAGVDGTIASRMRGTPAQGNVHAKTGFVDKARSLSGYVTSADGQLLVFSLLCNNWTTPVGAVERVQDDIAARLAAFPVKAR